MSRATSFAAFMLLGAAACAADPEIERRGGGPVEPVMESPTAGAGEAGGGGTTAGTGGSTGTGGASGGSSGGASSLIAFCDALTVVREKCQRCHGAPLTNGAPVPFLTFEDFHAQYGTSEFEYWEVAQGLVDRNVMPYVALNDPPTSLMPPVQPLTDDEKTTLLTWLKQGALPEGGTDCP